MSTAHGGVTLLSFSSRAWLPHASLSFSRRANRDAAKLELGSYRLPLLPAARHSLAQLDALARSLGLIWRAAYGCSRIHFFQFEPQPASTPVCCALLALLHPPSSYKPRFILSLSLSPPPQCRAPCLARSDLRSDPHRGLPSPALPSSFLQPPQRLPRAP